MKTLDHEPVGAANPKLCSIHQYKVNWHSIAAAIIVPTIVITFPTRYLAPPMTDQTKAPAPRACPVCSAPMSPGEDKCPSCGATHHKRHTCPFCGVVAQAEPHKELRLACPACGAPRPPAVRGVVIPNSAVTALRTARSAKSSRSVWRIATALGAFFGLLALLILAGVAIIASPGFLPVLAGTIVSALPILFAIIAVWKARQRDRQILASIDLAWCEVAKELAAHKGTLRAADIASAFSIPDDQAFSLLTKLTSQNGFYTDINNDGVLGVALHSRVRVEPMEDARPEGVEVPVDDEQTAQKTNLR